MRKDLSHETLAHYSASGRADNKVDILSAVLEQEVNAKGLGLIINSNVKSSVAMSETAAIQNLISSLASGQDNFLTAILQEQESSPIYNAKAGLGELYAKKEKLTEALKDLTNRDLAAAKTVAACFVTGLARHAVIKPNLQSINYTMIDSHTNHPENHLKAMTAIYSHISEIFMLFKNTQYETGSLFDKTTFMITSDFSRTPALNGSNGKDHNVLTNSVILAGRGIKGKSLVGKTALYPGAKSQYGTSIHAGLPIEFKTGKVITDAKEIRRGMGLIFPENVVKTVYRAVTGKSEHPYIAREFATLPGIIV
jgi:uncharacterized protein (DUF1501 family)